MRRRVAIKSTDRLEGRVVRRMPGGGAALQAGEWYSRIEEYKPVPGVKVRGLLVAQAPER